MLKIFKSSLPIEDFQVIRLDEDDDFESMDLRCSEEAFQARVDEEVEARLDPLIEEERIKFQTEFDSRKQEVFDSGLEEGKLRGIELERLKVDPLMKELSSLIKNLNEEKRNVMMEAEELIVKLAFQIGSKIIQKEIISDEKLVIQIVRSSLKYATDTTEIKLYLNDEDANIIQTYRSELGLSPIAADGLEIVRDPGIQRGGCVIETNAGTIDATVEMKINQIWENLKKGFKV